MEIIVYDRDAVAYTGNIFHQLLFLLCNERDIQNEKHNKGYTSIKKRNTHVET